MEEGLAEYKNVKRLDYTSQGEWTETVMPVFRIAWTPFAKGGIRSAHLAYGPDSDVPLVAKRFLKESADDETTYRLDVAQQATAVAIGQAFNATNPPKKVKFIPAFLVRVEEGESIVTYAVEEKLGEGQFVKYNSNDGFVVLDDHVRNTPQALSHFSWIHSGKKLLVADVQGVGDSFTDPGIQSLDRRFGYTDLGAVGVAFFFSSHVCNPICESLGLAPFPLAQSKSGVLRTDNPVRLRKGPTIPNLQRALPRSVTARVMAPVPRLPSMLVSPRSDHLLLSLPDAVPNVHTPDSEVHLALGMLHETGRLAVLQASLKAALDGKETYTEDGEPDCESALFHYQKAAFGGHIEAVMIMALVHSGFQPRDYLAGMEVTDQKRALFFLQLAAQRNHRCALLHLGDMNFAQGKWVDSLDFYEKALKLRKPETPVEDDEVDTLGLLSQLPVGVWPNDPKLCHLYALIAESAEKSGNTAKAAEFYSSASEEALSDPMMAKQGMKWAEKAAAFE